MFLADAGLPMIFLFIPSMAVLIVPVIGIELLVAWRMIASVPFKRRIVPVAAANLASTFIGWPVAWLFLMFLEMLISKGKAHGLGTPLLALYAVTVQAPWLIPYEENFYWMVPAAAFALMVPFFFLSVYCERFVCRRFWREEDQTSLRRFAWFANLWSYLFLVLVDLVYFLLSWLV